MLKTKLPVEKGNRELQQTLYVPGNYQHAKNQSVIITGLTQHIQRHRDWGVRGGGNS